MIVFEMAFLIIVVAAIGGPLAYFGMRRYLRWLQRLSEREEARDEAAFPKQ